MTSSGTNPDLVSVIIPVFNAERYVTATLDSVFRQSYPHIEVLVVDNGSRDGSLEILRSYGERITLLHEATPGPAAARNCGIRAAQGSYLAFLDADDLWVPGKLAAHIEQLQHHPELGGSFSGYRLIDEQGQSLKSFDYSVFRTDRVPASEDIWKALLRMDLHIQIGSLVVRRSCVQELGGFAEVLRTAEDTHFLTRLAYRHRLGYVEDAPVLYRWHSAGISKSLSIPRGTIRSLDLLAEQESELLAKFRPLLDRAYFQRYMVLGRTAFRAGLKSEAKGFFAEAWYRRRLSLEAIWYGALCELPERWIAAGRAIKRRANKRKRSG